MTGTIIVGAGGHGREVADVVLACGHEVAGFLDDGAPDLRPLERRGLVVLGPVDSLMDHDAVAVLGIGAGPTRLEISERYHDWNRWSAALVHPGASTGTEVVLGAGTVIAAGARLTTAIFLGAHVYVGPTATIGHDTVLEDGVTVLPGATVSGGVHVGHGTTIGTGANVLEGVTIGQHAIVGAGAVVLHDVPSEATVVGVPARLR